MFDELDFSIINDPTFKEDSVREEIVVPILKRLGYTASGENRIIRSFSLKHPFVHIGTKSNKVNIIPDYLLHAGEEHKWVLDAKSPKENIYTGKNPEQAFSYAIHPDVRATKYALCNGKSLVVYEVSRVEPILNIEIKNIDSQWQEVVKCLSPVAFIKPHVLNYKPDFGLYLSKIGLTQEEDIHFVPMGIPSIAKVNDNLYTVFVEIDNGSEMLATSFDFDVQRYEQLLNSVSTSKAKEIETAMSSQPYKLYLEKDTPEVVIHAKLGENLYVGEDDDYRPLEVVEFKKL